MLLVVYSDNLLMLLIGWEGLGLASWGLIGHWFRDDDELSFVGITKRKLLISMWWTPSFAGWRAISTIRIGDMPMFFAIAAIYALTGTLDISQIEWGHLFHEIGFAGTTILLIAFLVGPLTKSAQLPFSDWLMTAMTGPTTVSALLHSATMVAAGTYVFMRLSWYIKPWELHSGGLEIVYVFMLFLGLISALYGASVALGCLERKVLLAASTMSSLGLMFASTATSLWVGKIGVLVGFWYLIAHAFAKATLFLVAGHLIHVTETRFCVGNLELAKKLKIAFIITLIATIFLSGIPPFTAYWIKAGMDEVMHHLEHEFGLLPLALLVLTSAVYSAFLAKFLSLNFVKGEKPHLHLHGGRVMATAYTAMGSMLLVLLYLILAHKEPVASKFMEIGYETSALAVGLLCLVAYSIGAARPRVKALATIGTVFGDRVFIPVLNDFVIPKFGWAVALLIDLGNRGIDFFCHKAIPDLFDVYSRGIRTIQKGYLRGYLKIVMGVVMFVLVALSLLGW
jgi:NADH-quinone oxidoreductase subunit L